MGQVKNETGNIYGKLTVICPATRAGYWDCKCTCGKHRICWGKELRRKDNRRIQSCGCLPKQTTTTHGRSHSPEHRAWLAAKNRCYNPNCPDFADYGGRGIEMAECWRTSFATFFNEMGPRPSRHHSLDRIRNHKHYEPGNCRWATAKEQVNNRRLKRIEDFSLEELWAECIRRKILI